MRKGGRAWTPYQELVEMSWTKFCVGIVVSYLAINAIFAALFVLNGVENINSSYTWEEIRWNARFRKMYRTNGDSETILELDQIDEIEEE